METNRDNRRWRCVGAVTAAEAAAKRPPGGVVVGVEWHGASLNGVYESWRDVQNDVALVEQMVVPAIFKKGEVPRQSAMNSILSTLSRNEHFGEYGPLVIKTLAWLATTSPEVQLLSKPQFEEARYIITEKETKGDYNWRLLLSLP